MRWRGQEKSKHVEDRRGKKLGIGLGAGGIVVLLIGLLMGADPMQLLNQVAGSEQGSSNYEPTAAEPEAADFVGVVLKYTEDVWSAVFQQQLNRTYQEPTLVLFTGSVNSACGSASAATGPFYCPGDQKLYIDLSFYDELKSRFNAPGDFAMAYVVAHEVGHHVQYLLGITADVDKARSRLSKEEYNKLSVKLELQADFLAGLWAHHAQDRMDILEEGDIEEALNAANAIGDDRLQKQSQGYVVPESFTHGTSAQRVRWFRKGFQTGRMEDGDTFSAPSL